MESNKHDDIFKAICDLIVLSDFISAQQDFYEKHKETFEDTDENKLEYTQIYEAYVLILDSMIDQELYKSYSHEQVQAFYDDFKEDVSKYEAINSTAVETLFGFVNFDKFK